MNVTRVGVALVLACLLALPWRPEAAVAQVTGEIIGPGATQYPIAIPALRSVAGEPDPDTERFADIVSRALTLSGYFRVLDRAAYIESPRAAATTADQIEFHNWSVIGALALVKGTLERTPAGLVIEARLFDVAGRRALTAKRYRAPVPEFGRIALRFADEILRVFTGNPGPFESQIAFVSTREAKTKEIYTLAFDAEQPTRVSEERTIALSPAWSPDAQRLIFTSYRGGRPGLYELTIGPGRPPRQIVATGALSAGGAWSPTGDLLAVSLEVKGNSEIVLLRPDGTLERQLTKNRAIDVSPSWSPDGREIAFCSDRAGGPQIFAIDVASGRTRRVTYGGAYNTSPAWSPRGDQIAYVRREHGRFQIAVASPKGGRGRMITNDPGDNEDPSWAPDGRYIAFSSTRDGRGRIFMVDLGGHIRKQLTHGEGNDSSPAWSPRLQ